MKAKMQSYIFRFSTIVLMCVILSVMGCGGPAWVDDRLDVAETLMENRPDSALAILDSIHPAILNDAEQKARYALLKSMALDKNYIDKTSFEVLQPAIDYYAKNGTPDEKLKTNYYQGRIFDNRQERDSALRYYIRGLDMAKECHDSLALARTLVAGGIIYLSFYDIDGYVDNYLQAAEIYNSKLIEDQELDCLINALNGLIILDDKEKAESVMQKLEHFDSTDSYISRTLQSLRFSYALSYGSLQEIRKSMDMLDSQTLNSTWALNLARAYNKLGLQDSALLYIENLDNNKIRYDTLKYLMTKYRILEDSEHYKKALDLYKDFLNRLEVINSAKFEQKRQSMEEKHRMELQAEKAARKHARMMWEMTGCVCALLMVLAIVLLVMRNQRVKRHLAEEKAENLAHRVEELESESEGLKDLLESRQEMPAEVRKAIQTRIEMLNSYLASQISDHKEFEKTYDAWVADLTANTREFMDSNRLAFQASHPAFIKYFEDHGLTTDEINYVCLYAIGLRGKDVGNYMRKRSHVNISSAIRKKLGIDQHETNIGIYVRKKLKEF